MRPIATLIATLSVAEATKVSLHEIQEKSQLNTRSFNPLSDVRDVGSNRISLRGNSTLDDIFDSQAAEPEESPAANSLSIGIADVVTASRKDQISPFLSTTLRTTLSPIPTSTLSTFNTATQSSFSDAYISFLEHVLTKQEVYDVKVLSVSIFDEELLNLDGSTEERGTSRKLLTNGLQFNFARDDDRAYDDEIDEYDDDEAQQLEEDASYKLLRFGIVVSAEHTSNLSQENYMSNSQFQEIVLHISNKFHDHLLEYVRDADLYFREVESVEVGGYGGNDDGVLADVEEVKGGFFKRIEDEIRSVEEGTLNTWSIISIALGGLMFVGLIFATVKFYKREQVLRANRWRSQEIAKSNANASSIKSLRVLYGKEPFEDDYSFDPLGTNAVYTEQTAHQRSSAKDHIQRLYKGFTDKSYTDVPLNNNAYEEVVLSKWPKVAPEASSPLFPGAPPASVSKSTVSYTLDGEHTAPENMLYNLPRQHVYAPPGKVGVAIDIQDSQPVVHKVKKGSPLEGLLQPRDIVVAIDDVDTNCMSAADVTHLMVKRMNYRRKITFVRRG